MSLPVINAPGRDAPPRPADLDPWLGAPEPGVSEVLARTPGPILVLGAGGKMGLHLCLMLQRALEPLGRGGDVLAVSRFHTLRDRGVFEEHGIATQPADLLDASALHGLPDAPTIFYLAGQKFGTSTRPDLLRQANETMPQRVAERFRGARITAFSSGAVYPFVRPETGGATEQTPLAPVGEYAESCVARERAFMEASRTHGTRVVLVRLNYSVELRYGVLVDIAQKVARGEPVDVTMGYLNAIWQRDAIAQVIHASELASAPATPINITGAETLSVRDLAQRFGQRLGRAVKITGTEAETALLSNAAESHRRFGRPRTSLEQMITWIAAWVQQGGATWGKPTGFEVRDGRY